MIFKSCCLLVLAYAFALLCGAFSWIFVSTALSFGILARNSLVGMCAVSLPMSLLAALIYVATCTPVGHDHSVDIFLTTLAVTSSAASGVGAAIFQTSSAGASIVACLFGGMVFAGSGFVIYSIAAGCFGDDDADAESVGDTESCRATDDETYRVVEQPCGSHVQLAVKS